MTKLFVRLSGGVGVAALAFCLVGLSPFLGSEPTAGAGLSTRTAPVSVDRTYKGDRLSVPSEINSAVSRVGSGSRSPTEIPFACDPAFSPISSPRFAHIYGRCMS
jgi:hypothetical protein